MVLLCNDAIASTNLGFLFFLPIPVNDFLVQSVKVSHLKRKKKEKKGKKKKKKKKRKKKKKKKKKNCTRRRSDLHV
jgi:hypothetical protein